jgi:hypothetical protein
VAGVRASRVRHGGDHTVRGPDARRPAPRCALLRAALSHRGAHGVRAGASSPGRLCMNASGSPRWSSP